MYILCTDLDVVKIYLFDKYPVNHEPKSENNYRFLAHVAQKLSVSM